MHCSYDLSITTVHIVCSAVICMFVQALNLNMLTTCILSVHLVVVKGL